MAESVEGIAAACESYWTEAGLSSKAAAEMRAELELHLREAVAEGKTLESVVGPNMKSFAQSWAEATTGRSVPSWDEVGDRNPSTSGWKNSWWLIAAVGFIAIVVAFSGKENEVDAGLWPWVWLGAALVLGILELLTGGFFIVPFAAGALGASILAFAGAGEVMQVIGFIVVSVLALIGLQKYGRKDQERMHPVGANRFIGSRAVVTEEVSRLAGDGRVRMDTEDWRATTDINETIAIGTEVEVVGVRGSRLLIAPLAAADE